MSGAKTLNSADAGSQLAKIHKKTEKRKKASKTETHEANGVSDGRPESPPSAVSREEQWASAMKAAQEAAWAEKKHKRQEREAAAELETNSEERPTKKRKKAKAEEESKAVSDAPVPVLTSQDAGVTTEATGKSKKSKARKDEVHADVAEANSTSISKEKKRQKKEKKDKKRKREVEGGDDDAQGDHSVIENDKILKPGKASRKARKSQKEGEKPKSGAEKSVTACVEGPASSFNEDLTEHKDQMAEKPKKKKKHSGEGKKSEVVSSKHYEKTESPKTKDASEVKTGGAPGKWNVSGLKGGDARQAKFLKLLGGKKNGISLATDTAGTQGHNSGSTKMKIDRVESDLSRQYEAGVRQKFEQGGPRRGLGA